MRKLYIPTLQFFEHVKKHKSKLITFSSVYGVTSTYQICYEYKDDLYCIIVNDAQMMQYLLKQATDMMKSSKEIESKPIPKPKKKKSLLAFWSK